ncbi:MAG: class I SAM-dependent methyltransferase [bacterium]
MKDKYNNFKIAFDDNRELKEFYDNNIKYAFKEVDFKTVQNIANEIQKIDKIIQGRFGGAVEDLLVVALVRYMASKNIEITDSSAHIEIGTLFGGTALLTSYILKELKLEDKIKNVMIDPLAGYYDNKLDFISHLEVNKKTLESNLRLFHTKNYEIIQSYSTEPIVIDKVSKYKIHSIFIDGDHSFSGLLKDWNNFNNLLPVDGYVVIDNVNDKNWPNINIFIKKLKELILDSWEIVYEANITLVLRKCKMKDLSIETKFTIDLIHEIEQQVDRKFFHQVEYRDQQIEKLSTMVKNREKDIAKLTEQVEYRDEQIEKLSTMVKNREKDIAKLTEQVEYRNTRLEEYEKKIKYLYNKKMKFLKLIKTLKGTKIPFLPLYKAKYCEKLIREIDE